MNRHTLITLTGIAVTGVALLSLATGCSNDHKLSFPADLPSTVPHLPGQVVAADASLGSCHVKVTGDVNAEWTADGGAGAVGYGPWVADTGVHISAMTLDETYFILNCQGDGGNYVGFMPVNEAKVPMQPGTYTISPNTSRAGTSNDGVMSSLLGFADSHTNWGPSADGRLVIAAFDPHHIAGTFTLPVTDVLADMNGHSEGNATITGEFDYTNPTG